MSRSELKALADAMPLDVAVDAVVEALDQRDDALIASAVCFALLKALPEARCDVPARLGYRLGAWTNRVAKTLDTAEQRSPAVNHGRD